MVFGGLFAAQFCNAQATGQVGNQAPPLQSGQSTNQQTDQFSQQQPGQSTDQLSGQSTDQQSGQSTDQLTGQAIDEFGCPVPEQQFDQLTSQQTGQSPYQQMGQSANQQMDQSANQQSGQSPNQQSGQSMNQQMGQSIDPLTGLYTNQQPSVTPAEIISMLQQEPDILTNLKDELAQQLGVDPTTISDQAIYYRIQQDPNVEYLAVQALVERGINPCIGAQVQNNRNLVNPLAPRTTQQQLTPQIPFPRLPRPYQNPNDPQALHRLSPYRNLPSLRDLYSQFPSTKEKLRRFGSDAFLRVTGNINELPMDLPAGPDYVLGPGDSLVVNIWGGQSGRLERLVDRQGQIALPEAGTITIAGLTIAQAQSAIQKSLGTEFQNEKVEISLGRVRTVRIYVVGDVQRPGAYDVSSLSTPVNALYAAGGPTDRGSLRTLRQYRGTQLVREIDLYDFLLRGIRSDVDRLQPGDTLLVPPVGPQVSVSGAVRRPAVYELKGEQTLDQVLDLAGGVLVSASLKQIRVERIEAHVARTMLSVQLPEGHDAASQDLPAFKVQDGDSVLVSQIMPYNEQAVYLDGHVFHPGKYPYKEGMTINDLLHSYQDVMPEPADHAELIRLQPPDFRPETISFNLPDVLIGNDAIALQPFDLVRVFGRYEIDSPKVTIDGSVLRPGKYPMSQGMTAADLVRIAGGFMRSAYREEADLTSYDVQNGQKVLLNHIAVPIQKALDGDKSADVALKPGDVLSIPQITGWKDIGAAVKISGEVAYPGTYGIEAGERLSSVLKRAGGFRDTAYPPGAVLDRVEVRQLGEQARLEMIRRVETTPVTINQGLLSGEEQSELQQAGEQQRTQVLAALRSHPATGRMVINISSDMSKWQNTTADIEMRPEDTLVIPKRQSFVLVSGQVYNQAAITYSPGKNGSWYLRQAGGVTRAGDKGAVFVVRANGSVVGHASGWLTGDALNFRMRPGDTIIVPEKTIGGSQIWKNIVSMAQIASSVAITGAVAGIF
jgi:protein involved in polysaccharide export with SLBB domain